MTQSGHPKSGVIRHGFLELSQIATHPVTALGNIGTIVLSLLRTLTVGIPAVRTLDEHMYDWTVEKRGTFIWNVASRDWAGYILHKARVLPYLIGHEQVDWAQPYVVAINHQSALDLFLALRHIPNGRFVAKIEALRFPIIGKAAKWGSQIIVDRNNRTQAMSAVRSGMGEWTDCNVIFFVEGTRTQSGKLGDVKAGAFKLALELNRPVLPVYIGGAYEALPKGSFLALKRPSRVTVSFGRPIAPNGSVAALMSDTIRTFQDLSQQERAFR